MDYTLAGIRNRILVDKLDDEDFNTSVLDNFINDAQFDIFSDSKLSFTEKMFIGDLPQGATIFQFPDDISALEGAIVIDENGKPNFIKDGYMKFEDFIQKHPVAEIQEPGPITDWSLYGGRMFVSRPIPFDYKMKIYYNKVPKVLVDPLDVPEVPREFQEALLLGAFYRVQFREGDSDEGLLTKSEYQRKIEQMNARYGFRLNNGPMKMANAQISPRSRARSGLITIQ